MSLSAERVALASQAVLRTFEQTCVAWQALPHWDTQNPGQVQVRRDVIFALPPATPPAQPPPLSLPLGTEARTFTVTLARAIAPNPDALLNTVIAEAAELAGQVDAAVLPQLSRPARDSRNTIWYRDPIAAGPDPDDSSLDLTATDALLRMLLDGRALLEDNGYRAANGLLIVNTLYRTLYRLVGGVVVADELMRGGQVGAAYRVSQLDDPDHLPPMPTQMIMIGRRQDMPDGVATHASAGEEPVDLAVSVPPGLEVVGDTADGQIELAVRIRFALRMKDDHGVVVFHS